MAIKVVVSRHGKRLHVKAPFRPAFRLGALELGARWKPRSQVWSFQAVQSRYIFALIREVYGESASTGTEG